MDGGHVRKAGSGMLTVEHLKKRYRDTLVLNDVSFRVPGQSITGIIGPNGAGKSTVLRIITGFERSWSGSVRFNGKDLTSFRERMSTFAYVPEFLELYPDYYTVEFIRFIEGVTGIENPDLVRMLGLNDVAGKKIRALSKGFKQRLKLFAALSNTKPVVVLDEPFDGFDPIQLLDILELISAENRSGRTFVMSVHQLSNAEKICQHYILLNAGTVVAEGSRDELNRKYGHEGADLEQIFMAAMR
jgi:ABC-2 type transport system ATP-binding protein